MTRFPPNDHKFTDEQYTKLLQQIQEIGDDDKIIPLSEEEVQEIETDFLYTQINNYELGVDL